MKKIVALLLFVASIIVSVTRPLSFPLAYYPEDWEANSYVDGPAFWRPNGYAIEVVSHSIQVPGKYFRKISVGDVAALVYTDGRTEFYKVSEVIIVKYGCPGNPYGCNWMVGEQEFTRQSFSDFVMLRKDTLVLHTSIAKDGDLWATGQTFYIAHLITP